MTHTSIDLHVHSTASDGTFTPTQLVHYAISKGLAAFALTDHDSVAGLDEAMSAAAGTSLEVIRGIEFSTVYQGSDVHIVGLDIDPSHPAFSNRLHQFLHSRETRNLRMMEMMQKDGIIISLELLKKRFGDTLLKSGMSLLCRTGKSDTCGCRAADLLHRRNPDSCTPDSVPFY